MPIFNVEQARKDGVPDKEIAQYLADKFPDFDLSKARADGVPDTEIANYLSDKTPPTQIRSPKEEYVPQWAKESPNAFGALGAGKAVWEQAAKPTIQTGAMTAGSIVGSGASPVAGSIVGAGTAYSISKRITDAVDRKIGQLEGFKQQDFTVLDEMIKSGEDIVFGGGMQAVGTMAGEAVIGPVSKALAPEAHRFQPYMKVMMERAKQLGMKLSPADVLESKTLALAESLMEKTITSADLVKDIRLESQILPLMQQRQKFIEGMGKERDIVEVGNKIKNEVTKFLEQKTLLKGKTLEDMRTKIMARLGTNENLSTLGLAGRELLMAKSIASGHVSDEAYSKIAEYLPQGAKYETPNLTTKAKDILDRMSGLPAQDKTLMETLKWAAKEPSEDILAQANAFGHRPDIRDAILDGAKVEHSWDKLQMLYKRLNALSRGENEAVFKAGMTGTRFQGTESGMAYGQLKKALTDDMKTIAESEGGKAWEQFQFANALYSKQASVFKSSEVQKMIAARPEDFLDTIFKPNGISEIDFARKAIGEDGFNHLRKGFTNRLLGFDKKETFDPSYLRNQMQRYGDETLRSVYDISELYALKQVAKEGLKLESQKLPGGLLKTISDRDPETVVDAIIGAHEAKLGSTNLQNNLIRMKRVLSQDSFTGLSQKVAEKIFWMNSETGLIMPTTFSKMTSKYDSSLNILFGPDKAADIRELANMAKHFQMAEKIAGNPSGTGQSIVTFGTLGMLVSDLVHGAVVAMTPRKLAQVYFSDNGIKWLTEGFKLPAQAGSRKAIDLSAKIVGVMNRDKLGYPGVQIEEDKYIPETQ